MCGKKCVKKKKGYVLVETIIVVTVLCTILVTLYQAFSNIIVNLQRRSLYDNTEYIYKTTLIRDYLDKELSPNAYNSNLVTKICEGTACTSTSDKRGELFRFLKVQAVYITIWDTTMLSTNELTSFDATTQHYIKSLDPVHIDSYRIIVMFINENNDTNETQYEYASLQMGDRK